MSNFVVLIVCYCCLICAPFVRPQYRQRMSIRNRILRSTFADNQQNWLSVSNPSGLFCVINFLKNRLPTSQFVSVGLLHTKPLSKDSNTILREIINEFALYLLHGDLDPDGHQDNNPNSIILIDDFFSLENSSFNYLDLCSSKCIYVAVLTQVFKDEQEFFKSSNQWIQMFWYHDVANVAIIYRIRDNFYMSKSVAFKSNAPCEPSPPISFGICQSGWKNWINYNVPLKLNNCTVDVAFFNLEPFSIPSNDSTKIAGGTEGHLLEIIKDRLNITMIGNEVYWDNSTDILETLQYLLKNHDLAFGGLIWSPTDTIAFSLPYEIVPIIWLLPASSQVSFRGLIAPFNTDVWIGIGTIFIAGAVKSILISKDISFLEIFSLFLGVSWYKQPTKFSTRLQFIFWAIYGYILTQFYLASLAGQLVNESFNHMATMLELVESGLKYGGTESVSEIFRDPNEEQVTGLQEEEEGQLEEEFNYVFEKLVNNFIEFEADEYARRFQNLIAGKSQKYALALMLNFSSINPSFGKNVYALNERLGSFPLAFAVRDGISYLEQFDEAIQLLRAYGFMDHFAHLYHSSEYDVDDGKLLSKNIGIKNLIPGFLLLAVGYALAFLSLTVEHVFSIVAEKRSVKKGLKKKKKKLELVNGKIK